MTIYSGFSHLKWWFSIVMLNYQRVLTIPHRNSLFGVEFWPVPVRLEFDLSSGSRKWPQGWHRPSWWHRRGGVCWKFQRHDSKMHLSIIQYIWIYWMYGIYWEILVKPNYIAIHQCTVSAELPELFIPLGRWPQNSWEFFILSWFSCSAQTFRSGRSG